MVSPVRYAIARIPRTSGVESHRQLPRFSHRVTDSGLQCLACHVWLGMTYCCSVVCCPERLSICSNISLIVDNQNLLKKAIWFIIEKAAGRRVSWVSTQVDNYTPGIEEQKCGWSRAGVEADHHSGPGWVRVGFLLPCSEFIGRGMWSCFKLYYKSLPTQHGFVSESCPPPSL